LDLVYASDVNDAETTRTAEGWQQIAFFLGLPISTVQRWAKFGMPVRHEGRRVQASPTELNRWLGREVSEPVQIANQGTVFRTRTAISDGQNRPL